MNEFIDPGLCSVCYTSFDAAVRWVSFYGQGALLGKFVCFLRGWFGKCLGFCLSFTIWMTFCVLGRLLLIAVGFCWLRFSIWRIALAFRWQLKKWRVHLLSFLGILIDTVAMECRLLEDKLLNLRSAVVSAWRADKLTLCQLQLLLGKLKFVCQMLMGRVFNCRLAAATAGVPAPRHRISLTREHKADLLVWGSFLDSYNSRCVQWGFGGETS